VVRSLTLFWLRRDSSISDGAFLQAIAVGSSSRNGVGESRMMSSIGEGGCSSKSEKCNGEHVITDVFVRKSSIHSARAVTQSSRVSPSSVVASSICCTSNVSGSSSVLVGNCSTVSGDDCRNSSASLSDMSLGAICRTD